MTPRIAVPLITLVVGVPAFVLGPIIWPPSTASPTPSGAQLPLFAVLILIEALLFGLGVAFLAFGFPIVKRAAGRVGANPWPVYLAIAWQLVSWWPHDKLHVATGLDPGAHLLIDYGFHVTMILAALVVARFFVVMLRTASAAAPWAPRKAREATPVVGAPGVGLEG